MTESDLEQKLLRNSPDTAFERFAKNFRNMGVVAGFRRGRAANVLVVETTEKGMNVSEVRRKGHEFDIQSTAVFMDDGEPHIRHWLRYRPDEE